MNIPAEILEHFGTENIIITEVYYPKMAGDCIGWTKESVFHRPNVERLIQLYEQGINAVAIAAVYGYDTLPLTWGPADFGLTDDGVAKLD